jgi:hypothetical protein
MFYLPDIYIYQHNDFYLLSLLLLRVAFSLSNENTNQYQNGNDLP